MPKISKRFKELAAKVEDRAYAPQEALELVKANATAKFDETLEAVPFGALERLIEEARHAACEPAHDRVRAVQSALGHTALGRSGPLAEDGGIACRALLEVLRVARELGERVAHRPAHARFSRY